MRNRLLRIEGETIAAVEEIVHNTIKLSDWLAAMQKLEGVPITSPVLPDNAVLYAQKGEKQLIVINQAASVKKLIWRTSVYRDMEQKQHQTRWTLAIPNHVFVLVFNGNALASSHIFFTPAPIGGENDMLFHTNLANVYFYRVTDQMPSIPSPICTGDLRMNVKAPFAERCNSFANAFWESEFNDDIPPVLRLTGGGGVFGEKIPEEFALLNAWEKATAADADFIAKMDWPFASICTVAELLKKEWS